MICKDGVVRACSMGKCPANASGDRMMTAGYTFFDNNSLKLTFQNTVTSEEAGNTVFEVEENDFVPLPSNMTLNGIHYSGYTVYKGNYTIDYADGNYGSVVLSIRLVP